MKLIIAIIQPNRLEAVQEALTEVEVFRLTVMDCQGFGRQKGSSEVFRGREFHHSRITSATEQCLSRTSWDVPDKQPNSASLSNWPQHS
jgi:nitrogen regulatory protein PII